MKNKSMIRFCQTGTAIEVQQILKTKDTRRDSLRNHVGPQTIDCLCQYPPVKMSVSETRMGTPNWSFRQAGTQQKFRHATWCYNHPDRRADQEVERMNEMVQNDHKGILIKLRPWLPTKKQTRFQKPGSSPYKSSRRENNTFLTAVIWAMWSESCLATWNPDTTTTRSPASIRERLKDASSRISLSKSRKTTPQDHLRLSDHIIVAHDNPTEITTDTIRRHLATHNLLMIAGKIETIEYPDHDKTRITMKGVEQIITACEKPPSPPPDTTAKSLYGLCLLTPNPQSNHIIEAIAFTTIATTDGIPYESKTELDTIRNLIDKNQHFERIIQMGSIQHPAQHVTNQTGLTPDIAIHTNNETTFVEIAGDEPNDAARYRHSIRMAVYSKHKIKCASPKSNQRN